MPSCLQKTLSRSRRVVLLPNCCPKTWSRCPRRVGLAACFVVHGRLRLWTEIMRCAIGWGLRRKTPSARQHGFETPGRTRNFTVTGRGEPSRFRSLVPPGTESHRDADRLCLCVLADGLLSAGRPPRRDRLGRCRPRTPAAVASRPRWQRADLRWGDRDLIDEEVEPHVAKAADVLA